MMARRKTIVKRLNAIQNFGAMDILCTDKTGTLTQNKVILERHLDIHGNDDLQVLEFAWLNSFHQTGLKNLLDVAVLEYAKQHELVDKLKHYRKIDEIPFDFMRRRMSVVVRNGDNQNLLVCKGAIEEMLPLCVSADDNGGAAGGVMPFTPEMRKEVRRVTRKLNQDGLRALAVAYKWLPAEDRTYTVDDEKDLVLAGYVAFLDPPKDTARQAIAALREHGVAIKIITGDNEVVTRKICKEVGLPVEHAMLGKDVEKLSDAELEETAEHTTIFAKMSPVQKSRVIRALQSERPHRRLSRRRHQRCGSAQGCRCRNFGGYRRRYRQGIGRHHPSGKEPAGAGRGRHRGPQDLRQHHQIHQDDGEFEFRQCVQRADRQHLSAVPADAADPAAGAESALRRFAGLDSVGRRGRDYLKQPRKWDAGGIARFMVFIGPISSIFDVVTFLVMWNVFRCKHGRKPVAVPVRLVCRRTADADADRAYDPHAAYSVHSEPRRHAGHCVDRNDHGVRHLSAVLITRRALRNGAAAVVVFPVARRNSAQLLRADATGKNSSIFAGLANGSNESIQIRMAFIDGTQSCVMMGHRLSASARGFMLRAGSFVFPLSYFGWLAA